MRKVIVVIMVGLLISMGCLSEIRQLVEPGQKSQYRLTEVYSELKDVDAGKNTRIIFEITNDAETTLSPKVSVEVNQTCFTTPNELILDKVPPKTTVRSFIYLTTYTPYYANKDIQKVCDNKKFTVIVNLQDINGKKLDFKSIDVGIIPQVR